LLAGDDLTEIENLTSRLLVEKFKVLPVKDRTAIITLARSEVPSLILLDLKSCFDICGMLKRNFVTEPTRRASAPGRMILRGLRPELIAQA
jgi:DNA-binding response OmpR family regulator